MTLSAPRHRRRAIVAAGAIALLAIALALFGAPAAPTRDVAAGEGVLVLTNAYRAQQGLEPLAASDQLTRWAEAQARQLARAGRLEHETSGGSTLQRRAEAAGYREWTALAENLASGEGQPDAALLLAAWLASAGHRAVLLSPGLSESGFACARAAGRYWCVQAFGARRR